MTGQHTGALESEQGKGRFTVTVEPTSPSGLSMNTQLPSRHLNLKLRSDLTA
jgi:hypothetical protein